MSNRHKSCVTLCPICYFSFWIFFLFLRRRDGTECLFRWSHAPVGNVAEDRCSHTWTETKKWVEHIFKTRRDNMEKQIHQKQLWKKSFMSWQRQR